jgi:hypothetical protein
VHSARISAETMRAVGAANTKINTEARAFPGEWLA